MAGTRGIAKFRGGQLAEGLMRDTHFDILNKINEDKVDIKWANHVEILENTKIDVWLQVNSKDVSGVSQLNVDTELNTYPISTEDNMEGLRLNEKVVIRESGTEDSPVFDVDGDIVYGRISQEAEQFILKFFSIENDVETPFTMPEGISIDFKCVLRTNMSVIPADAIVRSGGASFVEGATDAKAYLNLNQLMKDLYGAGGTLDNDGNSNLEKDVLTQISDEVTARSEADQQILSDLLSTVAGKGASLVGVQSSDNYTGATVQEVISDLAGRTTALETGGGQEVTDTHTRDAASENGYYAQKTGESAFESLEARIVDIESIADAQFKDKEDRVTKLETEDDRHAFEAVGGETEVLLPSNKIAKDNSLFLSINGAIQAPGINYVEKKNVSEEVIGVTFDPETLVEADVVFMWWKNK